MRRIGNLWERLASFEHLLQCATRAARRKRRSPGVRRFEFDLETNLGRLAEALRMRRYRPGPFRSFTIFDPKARLISAAPFVDRVVHHALVGVLEPVFERRFIFDSYACRVGKGTHAAVDRYTAFARRYRYALKCDVAKFFPSVDHDVLMGQLRRAIKDPGVLWLARLIIEHGGTVYRFRPPDQAGPLPEGPSHDGTRGLPIGNQTSQFFANVMLDPLDHFVKEQLRCRAYLRYVDDFVLLDNDKGRLARWRGEIEVFLAEQTKLSLHARKRTISRVTDGLPLLGYRVWPTHRRLARANVHGFRRRFRAMAAGYESGRLGLGEIQPRVSAWIGHARHANTWRLRARLFAGTVFNRGTVLSPRPSGRRLEQQASECSVGEPEQERGGQPEQQHGVPGVEHCAMSDESGI